MNYTPLNYEKINVAAGTTSPSTTKMYNNKTYCYWQRSLFQRACSVLMFDMPEEWQGSVRDFFYYCLFKYGYVAVFKSAEMGAAFQPCTLNGYNFYYQPTNAVISNPLYSADLKIGEECELIKLTPDYMGIWDVIDFYATKLSLLDNALQMSLINNKFAFVLGARNKTAGEALKKILDKINQGEPAVIYDMKLLNDPQDKAEPWQFLERQNLKSSYLTTEMLENYATILNQFDSEIGIPTLPYQKKERMVVSEAESKIIDATSRSVVWFDTISSSIEKVNQLLDMNLSVSLRYDPNDKPGEEDVDNE